MSLKQHNCVNDYVITCVIYWVLEHDPTHGYLIRSVSPFAFFFLKGQVSRELHGLVHGCVLGHVAF